MKTNILPRSLTLLAVLLVATALIILLLSYMHMAPTLMANVGWHDEIANLAWINCL